MSKIQKIDNTNKRPLINPKTTGYAAAGAIALTTIRAFSNEYVLIVWTDDEISYSLFVLPSGYWINVVLPTSYNIPFSSLE